MTEFSEGSKTVSRVEKSGGETVSHKTEQCGDGKFVEHNPCAGMAEIKVSSGRTVELAPFEFARLRIQLTVRVARDANIDPIYGAMKVFVQGAVAAEEAAVKSTQTGTFTIAPEVSEVLNGVICRRLNVSYGLTLKTAKKFESEQVDIGIDRPVLDAADILEAYTEVSDEVGNLLRVESNRIKNGGGNIGI